MYGVKWDLKHLCGVQEKHSWWWEYGSQVLYKEDDDDDDDEEEEEEHTEDGKEGRIEKLSLSLSLFFDSICIYI